ncbi:MAG: YidC/Oxa1 family membrane protein insertase, partial [Clostridia bacterium]|nr:YidC/Oxa1 family membrane protein insertase [Clostridia bacterium]
MKNVKTMQRSLVRLLALLLCAVAVLTLVSCRTNDTTLDTSFQEGEDAVTYFARVLKLDAAAREKFVAASRGYGYDENEKKFDETPIEGVNVEAAKAALAGLKPTGAADAEKFDLYLSELTPEQVTEIVTKMAEEVSFEPDNGPIDTLLVWIGQFVNILTKATGGKYVLGLFLFAIVVELLMLPFGIKQQKNSIKQAKMRPKEMAIRKKYAGRNDQVTQQKMSQEIQKMYQEEGFNPMGGCLPLLIQLPIVMALYQIVINPLRYVLNMSTGISNALTTYCTTARAAGGL